MSVLIKDMETPETCDMCPMLVFIEKGDDHDAFCYCKLSNWKKSCTPNPMAIFEARRFRHLDCPLIELPPHGDLIDRDALNIDISESVVFTVAKNRPSAEMRGAFKVLDRLEIAPTIIPAEPSEEQREYEAQVEAAQYCEMYEPTYDPETGAL